VIAAGIQVSMFEPVQFLACRSPQALGSTISNLSATFG
jgi:hypothetical protein